MTEHSPVSVDKAVVYNLNNRTFIKIIDTILKESTCHWCDEYSNKITISWYNKWNSSIDVSKLDICHEKGLINSKLAITRQNLSTPIKLIDVFTNAETMIIADSATNAFMLDTVAQRYVSQTYKVPLLTYLIIDLIAPIQKRNLIIKALMMEEFLTIVSGLGITTIVSHRLVNHNGNQTVAAMIDGTFDKHMNKCAYIYAELLDSPVYAIIPGISIC